MEILSYYVNYWQNDSDMPEYILYKDGCVQINIAVTA